MLDALRVDVRHSVRRLRRSPGLGLVVIATLALVIGANTAVFSLLNGIVLRPLEARDPGRLVSISPTDSRTGRRLHIYGDALAAFRQEQHSFSALALYSPALYRIEAPSGVTSATAEGVTPEYFDLVGAHVASGRFLTAGDIEAAAAAPVALISERLRRRMFNSETVLGRTISVDATPVTIVGVLADGFKGLQRDSGVDLFLPLSFIRMRSGDDPGVVRAPFVIARLSPGVSLAQARAEVVGRWPAIQAATLASVPEADRRAVAEQRLAIESAARGFSGAREQWGDALAVTIGLAVVLLAVACVNLMSLMSARALARQHEIAVCLALGVSRARLFRQMLVDGLLLAFCGLAAGLPLAWWGSFVLQGEMTIARAMPLDQPWTPDGQVVLTASLVAVVMGLLIGFLPAWRAVRGRASQALRPRRAVARSLGSTGRVVLVAQIALSMVLVAGAGLFAGMLSSLNANDAGFRDRPILWTRLTRNPGDRAPLDQAYFRDMLDRLAAMPGVDGAVYTSYFPAYLGFRGAVATDTFFAAGSPDASIIGLSELVTPGFFEMFGINHLQGRDFTWADEANAPSVTIVSHSLATRLFPNGDAIGRHLQIRTRAGTSDAEIVGVVADAPMGNIRDPQVAVAFRPMMQDLARGQYPLAHVRVTGSLTAVRDEYISTVAAGGHHYVPGLFTLEQWLDNALLQERLMAGVSTSAAALAVLLACIGIYGSLAYAVTARFREIGVRVALGASRTTVLQMIVRDGLAVVVPGVLIGIPLAVGAAMLVRSQLYGVTATDSSTFAGAAAVFIVTGLVAALLPAMRASRVDPVEALRQE